MLETTLAAIAAMCVVGAFYYFVFVLCVKLVQIYDHYDLEFKERMNKKWNRH